MRFESPRIRLASDRHDGGICVSQLVDKPKVEARMTRLDVLAMAVLTEPYLFQAGSPAFSNTSRNARRNPGRTSPPSSTSPSASTRNSVVDVYA